MLICDQFHNKKNTVYLLTSGQKQEFSYFKYTNKTSNRLLPCQTKQDKQKICKNKQDNIQNSIRATIIYHKTSELQKTQDVICQGLIKKASEIKQLKCKTIQETPARPQSGFALHKHQIRQLKLLPKLSCNCHLWWV